jgi:hypothetical protein
MRNDAFPAPPSPINTALSSCIRGGGIFWKREGCFERKEGDWKDGRSFWNEREGWKTKRGGKFLNESEGNGKEVLKQRKLL